jgi:two-component system, NtrC family, response regulator PilR
MKKSPTPARTERILVVDDEETMRDLISMMLTTAGYQCQKAASGDKALALLDSGTKFDLVLTDIQRPDAIDGIALLKRIRKKYPDVPVIMVTAGGSRRDATFRGGEAVLACLRLGAYDYVLKPFERMELLIAVQHALEHRRRLKLL